MLKLGYIFAEIPDMPLPLLLAAFGLGSATKKEKKKTAVSGYKKKNGTKVKAYTKKAN